MVYRQAGITQYTRRLTRAMFSTGSASPILMLDRRDEHTEWVPPDAMIVRTVTPAHHRFERFLLPFELRALSIRHPFTLLHSPDFITCVGTFKKVITIHDLYFLQNPNVLAKGVSSYYSRVAWSARKADHIIAVSQFTKDDIVRILGVSKCAVTVVHEAADDMALPSPASQPEAIMNLIRSTSPYAIFIGTIEPRKNLATLIQALGLAPMVQVVIAGAAGWAESGLQALAQELGVSDRVTFLPQLDDYGRDLVLRHARCLVMPSLYEGFGLPPLEAMARGIPVICSNAGSLIEVVGQAALLHDPLDYQQLATQLGNVWQDAALRDKLTTLGLARAALFSWNRAAVETSAIYSSLLN